ncbi:MAG: restriction endonuclease subunit S [Bifidobacteriales bacterium]|nr:restriction endonuclease subunit S [Bifidobacteriales bacterium]
MTKTNVPRLRFKGFDGEWKDEKFKSLVERVKKTSDSDQYKKIEFSNIDEGKIISKLSINDTKGIAFRKNDILFGKLRPYLKNWYYSMFDGVAVGDFWIFRAKRKISNSMFIYYLIQTHRYTRISNYTTGTKMPRSDWNFVSNSSFYISNLEEQQKIGSFFAKIDKLIELQTKKLELLKKLKQGYLQKMFPQDGELEPRLRFSGFSGEWKEAKLGDVVNYEQPTRYIVNSTEYDNDYKTPVLTAGKSFILGYTNEENIKVASRESPVIVFDDFTANNHYVDFNFMVKSSAIKILEAKEENLTYFINCVLNNITYVPMSHNRQWISRYSKFIINIPLFKEQEKIVSLFQKIDELIEEQSNKLNQLKQQKKAYLQKMFI